MSYPGTKHCLLQVRSGKTMPTGKVSLQSFKPGSKGVTVPGWWSAAVPPQASGARAAGHPKWCPQHGPAPAQAQLLLLPSVCMAGRLETLYHNAAVSNRCYSSTV